MDKRESEKREVAKELVNSALQNWGQSLQERVDAWQAAFNFMGLNVKLFVEEGEYRGIGEDADCDAAMNFYREVTQSFPMGKVDVEEAMVRQCLDKYSKTAPQPATAQRV